MRRHFTRSQNKPVMQNGPLLTDHIELRDIDLELELLKRKREMIEKQQQLLANERQFNSHAANHRQRQFDYNEPPQMFQQGHQEQYNTNQNFSSTFGHSSAQSFHHHIDSQGSSLGKRPSETSWQPNSAPKRFSGAQGSSKKKFGAGSRNSDALSAPFPKDRVRSRNSLSQPKPSNQQPQTWNQLPYYMGAKSAPPSQRFNSSKGKPTNRDRDFNPTKVTKPKASFSNMTDKLVSYPIQKPKQTPSFKPSGESRKFEESVSFILHPDKVPSQQVAGRLELALGNILKEIRGKFADDDLYSGRLLSSTFMREVKQAIRERLRTVMLGKYVGKVTHIVQEYRKVFPHASDLDILKLAMDVQNAATNKELTIKLEETDNPENYFKVNMEKLLSKSLDEMFKKLHELYVVDNLNEVKMTLFEIDNQDISKDINEQSENNTSVQTEDKGVKEGEKENKETGKAEVTDVLTCGSKIESESETKDADASNKTKTSKVTSDKNTDEAVRATTKKFDLMIGSLIKRKLALLLPKFKPTINKLFISNDEYVATKKAILAKLQDKLYVAARMEAHTAQKTSNDARNKVETTVKSTPPVNDAPVTTVAASTPNIFEPINNLLYYVKIQGRPTLPKRKLMQTFLQQFNPKSIKKHRYMHLLFVGFANKEDYEKIVAVKQTAIDNTMIFIKVNEKANNDSQIKSLNNSAVSGDNEVQIVGDNISASSNSSKDLLNPDLDDQINDLLSSIRKEEEEMSQGQTEESESKTECVKDESNNQILDEEKDNLQENIDNQSVETGSFKPDESELMTDGDKNSDEAHNNGETSTEDKSVNEVATDDKTLGQETFTDNKSANEVATNDKTLEVENEIPSEQVMNEESDRVEALKEGTKETGRATPTRMSARLGNVTPSSIRTRRASRLAQN